MGKPSSTKRERASGNAGRCTKARSKALYAPKKKTYNFEKKRPTATTASKSSIDNTSNKESELPETASSSKIGSTTIPETPEKSRPTENNSSTTNPGPKMIHGYRFVDMTILASIFTVLSCPGCNGVRCLNLHENDVKKKGLASHLVLQCSVCLYEQSFFTSKQVQYPNEGRGGAKFFDVNARSIYASRQIGGGHEHLKKFCTYMNMPPPALEGSYSKMTKKLKEAAKTVAEKSMSDAAAELRGEAESADVGVSIDGTWQRKGYTSMNGVVTAISVDNGKVLDTAIMSKNCKGCTKMKSVKTTDPQRYDAWKASHKCGLNFKGSSPAMEKEGAINIYNNSTKKHGLYYTSFFGDGDSKSFTAVQNTYGPRKPVKKHECIGHYQKRVGTRLRKLKKLNKRLGGAGRLTDAKIDCLQNYFGIALRQNVNNLDEMVKSTKASMFHVAGYHDNCPNHKDSWCQYNLDKLNGTNFYKKKGFPLDVRQAILPTYNDLCTREKLEKCLHGRTQNANESFNGMIWNRIPKANHVGLHILSFAVYDAISHFNNGGIAAYNILTKMNMEAGKYTVKGLNLQDLIRKRRSAYRMSSPQTKRRKVIRHLRKTKQDKLIEKEGKTYEYGGFEC
ncbi:uncharacterized protein [Clytia hemisphaerica]|uniref:uncharacterized protein n=1 Tax=Clytia hemisphaerica TaxID=252671 RepID=UPI0034D58C80|eukprot:TCONS_00064057-protein